MKQIRVHPCLFRVIRGECFWLRLGRAVLSAVSKHGFSSGLLEDTSHSCHYQAPYHNQNQITFPSFFTSPLRILLKGSFLSFA